MTHEATIVPASGVSVEADDEGYLQLTMPHRGCDCVTLGMMTIDQAAALIERLRFAMGQAKARRQGRYVGEWGRG